MKFLILTLLLSLSAFAQDKESTTILIEECQEKDIQHCNPSEIYFAPQARANDEIMKFAVELTAPLPYTYAGGKISASVFKDILQVGLNAGLLVIPGKYEGTAGAGQVGLHIQVTPVPYKWGKRIYLAGKIYRSFEFWGLPLMNRTGFHGAIGYRQPLEMFGKTRYIYAEAGLEKDIMHSYHNETVWTLHGLTIGFEFKGL